MFKTFIFVTVTIIWVGEGRSKGSYHEPIVPGLLGPDAWKKNPTIFSPNGGEQMVERINPMGWDRIRTKNPSTQQNPRTWNAADVHGSVGPQFKVVNITPEV